MQKEGEWTAVMVLMKQSSDYVVVGSSATRFCKRRSRGKMSARNKPEGLCDALCFPETYCPALSTVLKP